MAKYQTLVNLSRPQKGADGKYTGQNDLVLRGETLDLTDDEAAALNANQRRVHGHDVLRKATQAGKPMPSMTGRVLTGRPMTPGADTRPDPKGSTAVLVRQETPEASDPQVGDLDNESAMDLPPGTRISAGV